MGGAMAAKTQMDKKDDETREAIKTPKDGYMPILHGKSAGDGRRINRLPSLGGRGSAPTQYPRPSQSSQPPSRSSQLSHSSQPATSAKAAQASLPAVRPIGRQETRLSWLITALVTIFGGMLRFIRLDQPHGIVFDETYYVKDAWTMLLTGEARDWPKKIGTTSVNDLFAFGSTNHWKSTAEYVVHPPFGKWLIALGLKFFGGAYNIAAWRISTAIAGTIAILLLCRVAFRLFRSIPLMAIAGLLMSVDGLGIVMSRTGILDNFLMVLVLAAFLCLLRHRDWAIHRLSTARDSAAGKAALGAGPRLFFSWWRLAAAILLGLSCSVKWSGIYFFAAFAVISVLWDACNRHEFGFRGWFASAILRDGLPAALYMIPTVFLTYLATWTGWFIHPDSYMHQWASAHPGQGIAWLPEGLRSFVEYHRQMWIFHTGLDTPHTYMANAWLWPLQIRPTSFWWTDHIDGSPALCSLSHGPASNCVTDVVALGNPLIWWLGTLCAILMIDIAVIARQGDWKAVAVLAGWLGGWLPWIQYTHRTTFNFYAIVILPWLILSIIYLLDWLRQTIRVRAYRITVGILLTTIIAISIFFYPIWTAIPVPYDFWRAHMWFTTWI